MSSKPNLSLSKLDFATSEKKLWLVKVPNFLAQRWTQTCEKSLNGNDEQGPELGRMRVVSNAGESSSDFQLTLTGADVADLPMKEYSVKAQTETAVVTTLHAFSDNQGRPTVEGKVDQKFDVNVDKGKTRTGVVLEQAYRDLNRKRNVLNNTKTRTIQMIDDPRGLIRPIVPMGIKRKAGRFDKTVETKRSRMDKDELEKVLFSLFEKQAHWTFTQLQRETEQPAVWLKEVLAEVALLNKKGPHKDLYEVKKEYKRRAKTEIGAA